MRIDVYKYLMEGSKKMETGSSRWYPVKEKEGTGAN